MAEAQPDTAAIRLDALNAQAAYSLLTSLIIPRPIAWVSTVSPEGVPNLAPYSFFNLAAGAPPTVMISIGNRRTGEPKDTLKNATATGEFVVNLATESLAGALNDTSLDWQHGISEFKKAGTAMATSDLVRPPRVANAPVALECHLTQVVPVEGAPSTLMLGRVERVHVWQDLLAEDGLADAERFAPIARLGRNEYAALGTLFRLDRPTLHATRTRDA